MTHYRKEEKRSNVDELSNVTTIKRLI